MIGIRSIEWKQDSSGRRVDVHVGSWGRHGEGRGLARLGALDLEYNSTLVFASCHRARSCETISGHHGVPVLKPLLAQDHEAGLLYG